LVEVAAGDLDEVPRLGRRELRQAEREPVVVSAEALVGKDGGDELLSALRRERRARRPGRAMGRCAW
jgi:hypothetical protein